jgi:hypothetical protein
MTTDTAHHAATVIIHAIDTFHGCHLNVDRDYPEGVLGFLAEAAEYINVDADVVAEVGVMPMPAATVEDGPERTMVTYPDGSAIGVGWDAEGLAEWMAVYPHVGAEPAAVYR